MSRESRFVRRRTGLAPQGGGGDFHYRTESDYYKDIEKARDMERNDCIIGQTTQRSVANIVQDGFTLDPQTGDKTIDDELYYRWQEFANDPELCDVAGEYTFHDYENHACHAMQRDGDCVVVCTEDGSLQFLEAHTIQTLQKTENTFLGVEKDEFGRRVKYHVVREDNVYSKKSQADPIDVMNGNGMRQLFHIYNSRRMTMTRGVTAYAPIFEQAGMFEDIQFAKLVQQQVASCFAVFRKQSVVANGGIPPRAGGYGSGTIEASAAGTRYIENIAPGMEIVGAPGEELQGFSPNVPNSEYFSHVRLMLQIIGVNLGLPLCLVLMDGSETNFSGWRGAVDEARKGFKQNQRNLMDRLHKPLYQLKVAQWMEQDAALREVSQLSGINIFKHKWNSPRWAYIDPVGDAQGDMLRLQNGLTSPRRLHAERGAEWQEISDEIVLDMAYMIRRAKAEAQAINADFPDSQPVQWRELANLPMPSGVQMTMQDPQVVSLQEQAVEVPPDGN
jgi:lambda family phage portal protein